MTKKIYDALITETYTDRKTGEDRTKFHNVGTVFENEREGWTMKVHDGLSVSGRVVILPRKEKAERAEG